MKQDELITLWEEGNKRYMEEQKIDRAMIEKYLKGRTLKGSLHIKFTIIFYWFIQVANLILLSLNLAGYMKNSAMVWVLIPQAILTIGIMVYGMDIFYKLKEINNYSQSIHQLIIKQLRFFRGPFEIWLVLASLSAIILMINVNFYIDNDQGNYHIYKKVFFALVMLAAFLIIYGAQKITSYKGIRSLKGYLQDLETGTLEQSKRLIEFRKRYIWLYVVIFLLLTASLVFGIIRATG
ncbi:MAG: hypothetical protein ACWGNV_12200 [Bacteroidales bacterium]